MTWRWLLVNQVLLLSYTVFCDMTCNTDGVKCFANPTGCTADCDFLLKYKASSSVTTQVEISGKLSAHSLGASNLWLAYGFSSSGGMSGMMVYACQKYGEVYTAKKRATTGYGVSSTSTNIATSGVEGSLTDGVMTCKYTINNSELPSGDLKMGYGMGTTSSENGMNKHSQTPKRSADSFSLIQVYTPPPAPCSKPTVQDGTVAPDTGTVESGSTYQVSCNSGFTISGSPTITCTNGQLSTYPTCQPTEKEEEKKDPKECDVSSGDCYDHHSRSMSLLRIVDMYTLGFLLTSILLWWAC